MFLKINGVLSASVNTSVLNMRALERGLNKNQQ
jgi:hypothetical protein